MVAATILVNANSATFHVVTGITVNPAPVAEWENPAATQPSIENTVDVVLPCRLRFKSNSVEKKYKPEGQYPDGDCALVIANVDATPGAATLLAASGLAYVLDHTRQVEVETYSLVINSWRYVSTAKNAVYVGCTFDQKTTGTRI